MKPEDVEREFLALTLEQAVANAYVAIPAAVVIGLVAQQAIGPWAAWGWWGAVVAALLLRNAVLTRTRQQLINGAGLREARMTLASSTAALALVLGSLPALYFLRMDLELVLVLTMFYCCWCAAASVSMGTLANRRNYLVVMMLCLAIGWLRTETPHAPYIVLALALNGVALYLFGMKFAQRIVEGIAIRANNADLVAELQRANDAKTRFIMAASHDLRQPLTAISYLGGVLSRTSDPADAREASKGLATAIQGLNKLFSAVLDLSRIESGAIQPQLQHFKIDPLLARLDSEYRALCVSSGRRWECSLESATAHSDPVLLERILRNLLDNALKHGAGVVRLALQTGEHIEVVISDQGRGIAPEERARVFEEFYRGQNGTDKAGLGLGLSIVRRLADRLGCTLRVDYATPAERVGAAFTLMIPRSDQVIAPQPPPPIPQIDLGLAGLSVLVVDDDDAVLDASRALLQSWGCTVALCRDLSSLQRMLSSTPPAAVALIDYQLSDGGTGLNAIAMLRAHWPETGLVLVTGESDHGVLQQLMETELPLLEKPVDPEELRMTLALFRCTTEP